MARCAIMLSPVSGLAHAELAALAHEAEDAGYWGVFVNEAINDALMCSYAYARATRRIRVGTWIVNIYLRQPTLCAAAAEMVQDAADGRFILGLGVSHRPAMSALGIQMGNAREHLRDYTGMLRRTLAGEPIGARAMRFRAPTTPIPIYYAALALETARLGGELADGLMLHLCTPARLRMVIDAARTTTVKHGRSPSALAITHGMPVFMHDDLKTAYAAARKGLAFYVALPYYNRLLARSGFAREAEAVMEAAGRRDTGAMAAGVSDAMVDAVALAGPAARCVERLAERGDDSAVTSIILPNPVGEDYAACVRRLFKTFAASN
ncbi:MAG: LLM class flavin-dependent oxidoreductase [Candidatus Binataceae bacterium]